MKSVVVLCALHAAGHIKAEPLEIILPRSRRPAHVIDIIGVQGRAGEGGASRGGKGVTWRLPPQW